MQPAIQLPTPIHFFFKIIAYNLNTIQDIPVQMYPKVKKRNYPEGRVFLPS